MRESRPHKHDTQGNEPAAPWQVPVARDDIAETGRHFDLVADAEIRARIARIARLRDLPRLEASFDLTRHGSDGLRVTGRVSATVGQTCVVTLEPLLNEIEEPIDLLFASAPQTDTAAAAVELSNAGSGKNGRGATERNWSAPEPLHEGIVDLGALATEFLILGIDPYPRKPEAVFEPPADDKAEPGPFAALAKLTKGPDGH
jgi:uncharacterized metal-binding protein YceD (DUF177 family)